MKMSRLILPMGSEVRFALFPTKPGSVQQQSGALEVVTDRQQSWSTICFPSHEHRYTSGGFSIIPRSF